MNNFRTSAISRRQAMSATGLTLAGAVLESVAPAAARPRTYDYVHLDVFTDHPLSGNQLAVFLNPQGLAADQMLALMREMNFSETTFVFPAEVPRTDFRVRIFGLNLNSEIPTAGHPVIGTVFALANAGRIAPGRRKVVLGLGIGPTELDLDWDGKRLKTALMHQRLPEFGNKIDDHMAVAAALNVAPDDIMGPDLPLQEVSCGSPFLLVPVKSRQAVDKSSLDRAAMTPLLDKAGMAHRGVFIFSTEGGPDGATVYCRWFGFGVTEDAATGIATGPLGSYLARYGMVPREKWGAMTTRQGVKMGRPSKLMVSVTMAGDSFTDVSVGGGSVEVGHASIMVPS
jgi:trans-2,3-dihydro-3-hydroxyanthranilate isomerase